MTESEFDRFFAKYHKDLFRLLYQLVGNAADAEELTQEAFVRFHLHKLELLPKSRKPWLFRVAVRLGYDQLRHRSRQKRLNEQHKQQGSLSNPKGGVEVPSERAFAVRQVLSMLPEKQVSLLSFHTAGLSHKEMADALELNESSVSQLLWRAKKAFRESYDTAQSSSFSVQNRK